METFSLDKIKLKNNICVFGQSSVQKEQFLILLSNQWNQQCHLLAFMHTFSDYMNIKYHVHETITYSSLSERDSFFQKLSCQVWNEDEHNCLVLIDNRIPLSFYEFSLDKMSFIMDITCTSSILTFSNFHYYILFKTSNEDEKNWIYQQFFSKLNKDEFTTLFDTHTKDNSCIVVERKQDLFGDSYDYYVFETPSYLACVESSIANSCILGPHSKFDSSTKCGPKTLFAIESQNVLPSNTSFNKNLEKYHDFSTSMGLKSLKNQQKSELSNLKLKEFDADSYFDSETLIISDFDFDVQSLIQNFTKNWQFYKKQIVISLDDEFINKFKSYWPYVEVHKNIKTDLDLTLLMKTLLDDSKQYGIRKILVLDNYILDKQKQIWFQSLNKDWRIKIIQVLRNDLFVNENICSNTINIFALKKLTTGQQSEFHKMCFPTMDWNLFHQTCETIWKQEMGVVFYWNEYYSLNTIKFNSQMLPLSISNDPKESVLNKTQKFLQEIHNTFDFENLSNHVLCIGKSGSGILPLTLNITSKLACLCKNKLMISWNVLFNDHFKKQFPDLIIIENISQVGRILDKWVKESTFLFIHDQNYLEYKDKTWFKEFFTENKSCRFILRCHQFCLPHDDFTKGVETVFFTKGQTVQSINNFYKNCFLDMKEDEFQSIYQSYHKTNQCMVIHNSINPKILSCSIPSFDKSPTKSKFISNSYPTNLHPYEDCKQLEENLTEKVESPFESFPSNFDSCNLFQKPIPYSLQKVGSQGDLQIQQKWVKEYTDKINTIVKFQQIDSKDWCHFLMKKCTQILYEKMSQRDNSCGLGDLDSHLCTLENLIQEYEKESIHKQ